MQPPSEAGSSPAAKSKNVTKKRELPKHLTREQGERLLSVPSVDSPTGLRNRALMELMYRCGLRVSEACGIHVRDVKWKEGVIHLRPEVTKGSKEAYVPVPAATMRGLERWKAVRRQYSAGTPELITTLKGKPLARQNAWRIVQTCARRAGLPRIHPHMLRHSFATQALADGLSIAEVQQILRHSDVKTTMIYTHVALPELTRKMRDRGGEDW